MSKALRAQARRNARAGERRVYTCVNCPGEITVADSLNGGLITVNIDGHGKAAHRVCPPVADTPT